MPSAARPCCASAAAPTQPCALLPSAPPHHVQAIADRQAEEAEARCSGRAGRGSGSGSGEQSGGAGRLVCGACRPAHNRVHWNAQETAQAADSQQNLPLWAGRGARPLQGRAAGGGTRGAGGAASGRLAQRPGPPHRWHRLPRSPKVRWATHVGTLRPLRHVHLRSRDATLLPGGPPLTLVLAWVTARGEHVYRRGLLAQAACRQTRREEAHALLVAVSGVLVRRSHVELGCAVLQKKQPWRDRRQWLGDEGAS